MRGVLPLTAIHVLLNITRYTGLAARSIRKSVILPVLARVWDFSELREEMDVDRTLTSRYRDRIRLEPCWNRGTGDHYSFPSNVLLMGPF
jgi:hypothetical protein